ncbi:FecR family protein [Parabacteroides massiliensis]|mgnify:CR=1 FL=1|uniref:FecR family protein n=1 Tax=Parabacteroides massiliensis TaxID=1750560 RepID=UPI00096AA48C|nr:FecR domain-containing protein [Parabacteroides massiliensis]
MGKDYTKYKADELLNDDYFLLSELYPTEKDRKFWNQLQQADSVLAGEIESARLFLKDIKRISNNPILLVDEEKELWKRIQITNALYDKHKKKNRFLKIAVSIAASLLIILTYGWHTLYNQKQVINYEAMISTIPQTDNPSENVQLVLSKEKKISIEGKDIQLEYTKEGNININSEKTITKKEERKDDKIQTFNQLIVPIGKRSSITFTDGSQIWVNAGSRVIYPAQFTVDSREIFIEGEIYLDIVHDTKRPFIVKTRKMEIRDLGTQFGVSAYDNEANSHVVLVEGKVEIETKGERKSTLNPNQLFLYNNKNNEKSVHQVNTQDYVAWKDGYYQFNHQKLDIVLEKLCKYYGIKIHWDEKIHELTCSGKLDLKENPEKVLNALQNAAPIKVEKIDDQIFIIKH